MNLWWKLGGVAVMLLAAYFLVTMYGGARYKQGQADSDSAWSAKVIQAEKEKLAAYQAGIASVGVAENTYHETVREKLIPITKTIVERAVEYAQTPEGSSICLPIERVRSLDETRSALFPPASTVTPIGGSPSVSPDGPER
jgi:hypothetical protein